MASEAPSETRPGFEPHVPPGATMREFTLRAIILGTLLGMVFGASSLYLVLKVGLTVSASIPVAVISITLFRLWSKVGGRDATILENNIVQTAGSAGESIAFGARRHHAGDHDPRASTWRSPGSCSWRCSAACWASS